MDAVKWEESPFRVENLHFLRDHQIKPKLSDLLLDLHQSLAHKGFAKILGISTGMPVEDPGVFSGRFLQIFLHQDLSTCLRKNRSTEV
jgi:hypothetical protein